MDPMGIGFHGIDVIHLKLPQWPSEFASTFIKVWPNPTHTIHVWYIYLHERLIFMANVGKYTSPMDCLGYTSKHLFEEVFEPPNISWGSALRVPNTEPHQVWLEDFGCLENVSGQTVIFHHTLFPARRPPSSDSRRCPLSHSNQHRVFPHWIWKGNCTKIHVEQAKSSMELVAFLDFSYAF